MFMVFWCICESSANCWWRYDDRVYKIWFDRKMRRMIFMIFLRGDRWFFGIFVDGFRFIFFWGFIRGFIFMGGYLGMALCYENLVIFLWDKIFFWLLLLLDLKERVDKYNTKWEDYGLLLWYGNGEIGGKYFEMVIGYQDEKNWLKMIE
jgi:hypothetical protein